MTTRCIVVGVDGSPGARAALGWAADEARARGWPLHVLFAWNGIGVRVAKESGWVKAVTEDLERDAAEELVHSEVTAVLGAEPDVEVVERPMPGEAAEVLIEASRDADLLVVGSRGEGGFAGLRLGSVSQKCTMHSHCAVVVVPGAMMADTARAAA